MTKTTINLLLLLCFVPFLVQCASQREVQSTNLRMYSIDSKVEGMDQQIEQLKSQTVRDVQGRQAALVDRLDNHDRELNSIKGILEENAHYNRMQREEYKETQTSLQKRFETVENNTNSRIEQLDKKIEQLSQQLTAAENQIRQTEEGIKKANEQQAKEASDRALKAADEARKAAKTVEETKGKSRIIQPDGSVHISAEKTKITPGEIAAATPSTPEPGDAKTDEIYNAGLSRFKEKQYDQAYDKFSDYLSKYPKGNMAPNARFWMGECLYNKKELELAILDYQKVIADFPKHSKAPAALLKQGMAFEELKDLGTAKIVYQKILDDYPTSEQANLAKKRVENLK